MKSHQARDDFGCVERVDADGQISRQMVDRGLLDSMYR